MAATVYYLDLSIVGRGNDLSVLVVAAFMRRPPGSSADVAMHPSTLASEQVTAFPFGDHSPAPLALLILDGALKELNLKLLASSLMLQLEASLAEGCLAVVAEEDLSIGPEDAVAILPRAEFDSLLFAFHHEGPQGFVVVLDVDG